MSPNVADIVTQLRGDWLQDYITDHNNMLVLDSEGKYVFKQMVYGVRIKGLICSRNYDPEYEDNFTLELNCDTSMSNNIDFEGPLFTRYQVRCPKNCVKKGNPLVVGLGIFKDDSPICLAAI
jgi:hypothetical protein